MFKILLIIYLSGFILASISNFNIKRGGMEGVSFLDTLNPLKWASVIYGTIVALLIPKHVLLQYCIRILNKDCSICVKKGVCVGGLDRAEGEVGCGCHTYSKMLSPYEEDYSGNWGKILSKKDFKEFLKNNPIKINVEINEEFV